jgi:putative glutamine amidotransferase
MKSRHTLLVFLALTLVVFFGSCRPAPEKEAKQTVIALSKSFDTYKEWLLEADSTLSFINLYGLPIDKALEELNQSNGLLLTGGEDIHPSRYQRSGDTVLCNSIDTYRDSLEIALVAQAAEDNIPLLGICRGMQLMNVALGGSLHADISTQFSTTVAHRMPEYEDTTHHVVINQVSLLHLIAETHDTQVVSNHHQGVDKPAQDLRVVAHSGDGLAEALEWQKPAGKRFFLGVQFHPERNRNSDLSASIAAYFAKEVQQNHHQTKALSDK